MKIKSYPSPLRRSAVFVLAALVLAAAAGGCGKSAESYVPASEDAKSMLERALTAWKTGAAPGRIEPAASGQVPLEAVDTDWRAGRKLQAFEIVSEKPRSDGPRQFSVRLTLSGSAAPVEATYYIVGQDPIWIFRDRDYMQTTTM